ncbi:MAG: CoA pyrophosphatase [Deltaproteobacteria bacterium]|nr:CoA pyrophosphatase [Deltaproteobacteria bacterium]
MHDNNHLTCSPQLLAQITANLKTFKRRAAACTETKRAAVALTVVDFNHGPAMYDMDTCGIAADTAALILTLRAGSLRKHAGQWALPGGRMEADEEPEDAALRELAEEVGLRLDHNSILGILDDFTTRSGYTITPVVIWAGTRAVLTPNPAEVASIHRIPLAEFMRPDAPILENIPESPNPVLMMPVGSCWIAAPTAAMIYQFREAALLGNATRVDHYEQPYFAWR